MSEFEDTGKSFSFHRATQAILKWPVSVKVTCGILAVCATLAAVHQCARKVFELNYPTPPTPRAPQVTENALENLGNLYNPDGTPLLAPEKQTLDGLKEKLASIDKPLALFIDDLTPYQNEPSSHALETVKLAPDLHCLIYHEELAASDMLEPLKKVAKGLEVASFFIHNEIPIKVVNISMGTEIGFNTLNAIFKPLLDPEKKITPQNAEEVVDQAIAHSYKNEHVSDGSPRVPFDFSCTDNPDIVLEVIDSLSPLLNVRKDILTPGKNPNASDFSEKIIGNPVLEEVVVKFGAPLFARNQNPYKLWRDILEHIGQSSFVQERMENNPQGYIYSENCANELARYEQGLNAENIEGLKKRIKLEGTLVRASIGVATLIHGLIEFLEFRDIPVVVCAGNEPDFNLYATSKYAIVIGALKDGQTPVDFPNHAAIDGHIETPEGKSGSSFVAPIASNHIGLMKAADPDLEVAEIERIIEKRFKK